MKPLSVLAVAPAIVGVRAEGTPSSIGVEQPSTFPVLGQNTVQGCFSSNGSLVFKAAQTFNTQGSCAHDICFVNNYTVGATTEGNQCWCGNSYPPQDSQVDDSKCNTYCTGFNLQACGGHNFWTVYNTGKEINVDFDDAPSSTSSANTPAQTSPSTVLVTEAPSSHHSSGSSAAGIAAGVVVGVLAIAGAGGGLFVYMRRKRKQELEDEHRRTAAVTEFFHNSKPSSNDSRLDPSRRMSDGSIADNQDYSRRILRVTNA